MIRSSHALLCCSSHSFVSKNCSALSGYSSDALPTKLLVNTPSGERLGARHVYRRVLFFLAGYEFEGDLVELDCHGFDVILGMDWLYYHRANVDCYKKEVMLLHPPSKKTIVIKGR